ncbi:unnamed protein product [Cylindrotheca closterium]|uniref:Uncharacterized protein n=1 Tax=Cylindrotheca closterium TaxID=2856 RepID=A0AAD2GD32_9STRA|nr:unnamed protein product [Cylindrotheca closterium]
MSEEAAAMTSENKDDHDNDETPTTTTTTIHAAPMSPMKEAADLIQMLDITCTEMNNCAADAARDAETARKNARAASEIARRYMTRSFPKKTEAPFGFGFGMIEPTSDSVASTLHININDTPSPRRTTRPVAYNNNNNNNNMDLESKESGSFDDDEMDAIIDSSPATPLANKDSATEASSSAEQQRRKARQIYKSPTTRERIAQSHADDVLTMNIELERAKQALKSEQRMHLQTKTALETMRSKNRELEQQKNSLQKTVDTELKEGIQNRHELEHELRQSNLRLQAAEDDAQLALDLAKESAEKRDEMEMALQRALYELEQLKSGKSPSPSKRSVRFADQTPPPPPPPPRPPIGTPTTIATTIAIDNSPRSLTPRSMVAAGRQLLMKHAAASPKTTTENGVVMMDFTPAKSAEKRRRFRERLEQLGLEDSMPSPRRLPSTPPPKPPPPLSSDLEPVVNLLKESGERLNLGGQWWRSEDLNVSTVTSLTEDDNNEDVHLEAMTRQYCQSVEFKIERQTKDINELESLCGFLENKLVRGND